MTEPYNNLSVKKLLEDLVYLKINQSYIEQVKSYIFGNTIDKLVNEGYCHIIIDFSQIDFLDSDYVLVLLTKMKMLSMGGGSLRLVVMEDKPRLKFSINDSISELNLFLSKETAMQDFFM